MKPQGKEVACPNSVYKRRYDSYKLLYIVTVVEAVRCNLFTPTHRDARAQNLWSTLTDVISKAIELVGTEGLREDISGVVLGSNRNKFHQLVLDTLADEGRLDTNVLGGLMLAGVLGGSNGAIVVLVNRSGAILGKA